MARKTKLQGEVICLSDDESESTEANKKAKIDVLIVDKQNEPKPVSNGNTQEDSNDTSHWTIDSKDRITVPGLPSRYATLYKKQFEIRSTAIRFGIVEFNVDCEVITMKENDFEMRLRSGFQDVLNIKLAYSDVIVFYYSLQADTPVALIQVRKEFSVLFNRYIPTSDDQGRGFDATSKDIKRRHVVFCLKKLTPDMEQIHTPAIYHLMKKKCPKADICCISSTRAKEIYELVRYARIPVVVKSKLPLILTPKDLVPRTVGLNKNKIRFDLTRDDLYCLSEGQFLNDNIIDFYLQYIYHEKLSEEDRNRTYLFNSFFYTRLTQCSKSDDQTIPAPERRYNRIKRWVRDVDLFSKDFLIVPVNQTAHWFIIIIQYPNEVPCEKDLISDDDDETLENRVKSMTKKVSEKISRPKSSNTEKTESDKSTKVIIDVGDDADEAASDSDVDCDQVIELLINRKKASKYPAIVIFDSLRSNPKRRAASTLREFLQVDYDRKKTSEKPNERKILNQDTIPTIEAAVPQQLNFYDCGLFLLQYTENFFAHRPTAIDFRLSSSFSKWCEQSSMGSCKRRQILEVINRHRITKTE